LTAEVARLRSEVATLRGALQRLCAELGVDPGIGSDLAGPDA